MSVHHIYETKALVIGSRGTGEADRQLSLYTKEFGFVRALAQGVREGKSKLRYSLQQFSYSTIYLVRGRAGWRVVNARLERDFFSDCAGVSARRLVMARACLLLRRLVHGEERNDALFDALETGFAFIAEADESLLPETELLLALRILRHLGYIEDSPSLSVLLTSGAWNLEAVALARKERTKAIRAVNESLRSSHL